MKNMNAINEFICDIGDIFGRYIEGMSFLNLYWLYGKISKTMNIIEAKQNAKKKE